MAKITVKPGDGRTVRLPDGRRVPAEGMEIEVTRLIRKWIRIGDLVEVGPAPSPAKGSAPAAQGGGK